MDHTQHDPDHARGASTPESGLASTLEPKADMSHDKHDGKHA